MWCAQTYLVFESEGGVLTPYTLAAGSGAELDDGLTDVVDGFTEEVDGLAVVVEGFAEVVEGATDVVVGGGPDN
jgi:hypothetical protein